MQADWRETGRLAKSQVQKPNLGHPARSTRTVRAFLSNGMDQQEADDKHHRAGYAMHGERSRLRPARPQND